MRSQRRLLTAGLCLLGLGIPGQSRAVVIGPTVTVQGTHQTNNVGPLSSLTYSFDQPPTSPNNAFTQDFDDSFNGPGANTVSYTYTGALTNGDAFTSFDNLHAQPGFSPLTNMSGRFVGFLGVDPSGNSSDITYAPTLVAVIRDAATLAQVGRIFADYNSTTLDDTTFTVFNDSGTITLDPPIFTAFDPTPVNINLNPESVPEPGTLITAATGGLILAGYGWLRRKRMARRQTA